MARIGVTYTDVAKAANALQSQNLPITIDSIRNQLGTGSRSTIGTHLKCWRNEPHNDSELSNLPFELIQAMKTLHKQTQAIADERVEQANDELKTVKDQYEKELEKAQYTIALLSDKQKELERQIEVLSTSKENDANSLKEANIKLAKAEAQQESATHQISELKQTVVELKEENRTIREHFQHYQQEIAEARRIERDQNLETKQHLQMQIHELKERVKQSESNRLELLKMHETLQIESKNLAHQNAVLTKELEQTAAGMDKMEHELDTLQSTYSSLLEKSERVAQTLSQTEIQKSEIEKELSLLTQSFESTQSELQRSHGRIEYLSDENKNLLQEKAHIQGQFKQLQDSLT